jgi:membrane protease YdiL (CAAX protease family)
MPEPALPPALDNAPEPARTQPGREPQHEWQRHPAIQIGAALIGVGPIYALSIYSGYQSLSTGELPELTVPLLLAQLVAMAFFGGVILALLLLLGEKVWELNLKPGSFATDIVHSLLLTLAVFGAVIGLGVFLNAFGFQSTPEATLEIGAALARDPVLLAIFIGPLIWLQAGIVEELTRVFLLSRLWRVWPSRAAKLVALFAFSAVFGLAHLYEGPQGVLGTAIIALVLGWHYLRFGRVLPLMIAHALYDTLVILLLVNFGDQLQSLPK